jgi:SAM-dependent methyltransferase
VLAANTPVAKRRLARELARTPRPLRIEIGGLKPRDGWVVTNVNAVARNFMDATTRWPVEDGAVAFAYADNVIEHITLAQARAMLREAYRCLAPDGVIRLVTPDIRRHVELYLDGRAALDSPAGRHYRNVGLVVEHPVDLLRVPIASFGHHTGYLYDFDTMASELTAAGFRDVVRCELGESTHPQLAGLDESREGGSQLVVEASR